jgi:hypothetical protein
MQLPLQVKLILSSNLVYNDKPLLYMCNAIKCDREALVFVIINTKVCKFDKRRKLIITSKSIAHHQNNYYFN